MGIQINGMKILWFIGDISIVLGYSIKGGADHAHAKVDPPSWIVDQLTMSNCLSFYVICCNISNSTHDHTNTSNNRYIEYVAY